MAKKRESEEKKVITDPIYLSIACSLSKTYREKYRRPISHKEICGILGRDYKMLWELKNKVVERLVEEGIIVPLGLSREGMLYQVIFVTD